MREAWLRRRGIGTGLAGHRRMRWLPSWIACVSVACSFETSRTVDTTTGPDASTSTSPDGGDAGYDAPAEVPASAFVPGILGTSGPGTIGATVPPRGELAPLPGGGAGGPVLTSNNPEIVTGIGVLAMNKASPTRGGAPFRIEGDFGIYLHHLNQSGSTKAFSVLITNPNPAPVTVTLRGSGYSQGETGGLALGASPDYRVSRDWILGQPATTTGPITLAPSTGAIFWSKQAANNQEVDGRFAVTSSAPVIAYVVMAADSSLTAALAASQPVMDAPGDYRISGDPPPPFGREAGIYAHDTWRAVFDVELPDGPRHVSWMVNTATGGGLSQVQAFPALAHYTGSAREAVGMYGNVYDLDIGLRNTTGNAARRVRVAFHSLATGSASRWWDGAATVNGTAIDIRHVPGSESTTLFEGTLAAGERRRLRLRAMVPGLASIPQALTVEVLE